jgi:hypothetical protein
MSNPDDKNRTDIRWRNSLLYPIGMTVIKGDLIQVKESTAELSSTFFIFPDEIPPGSIFIWRRREEQNDSIYR